MPFPYKNPISPIQVLGTQSVDRSVVFGTHFSTNGTGGFMEVFSLSGLTYEIPAGQTGSIEYSGNTIPINFVKGTGAVYSPDVLILNSDNISSGRRKLGMLAYVYELDQVYQYDIPNYEQLWTAATASTNCVFINEFGTTVRNNTTEGRAFINAWTASTIEGVNGVVRSNARWKKYWGNNLSVTGGSYNGVTNTLTLVNITGGTVSIPGFGGGGGGGASFTGGTFTQSNLEINLTSTAGTLTITGVTGLYISGGSYSSGNTTLSLSNSTGGTITITGFSQTFSGGSGNCINQLYLNEIYPCTSDIKIQPLSAGKVYFGSSNGASGFTVDLVTDTSYKSTRLGLNTNSPDYTFDFYARDRKNRFYYRDNLTGSFLDIKNIVFSGESDLNSSFSVISSDDSGQQGAHGISIGLLGYNTASSILNDGAGKPGDTFIQVFADTNGLNIINGPGSVGVNTEDYIRFYAGQIVNDNIPDLHIQGSGTTRGYIGINITGVTNQLHVSAATHPVRFEGLQQSALTRYLVADTNGVVYFTTGVTSGSSSSSSGFTTISITGTPQFTSTDSQTINFSGINISITSGVSNTLVFSAGTSTVVSGDYLPLSGGTVYGPTIFTSGVTANTLSSIDYIDFDLLSGASAASSVSRLRYVADEGGLVTTLLGGNIDLQIGQQNVVFCYNGDTENLTKGQVVAIIGNQGNRPKIQRAIASAETTSSTALGVVAETINTGNEGFVTTFGNVRGFELTGITPGSYVYLSPTVLGGFTGTQPQAPDHIVALGYVVRTGETQGEIFVNISNGWELNELHNVKITNPSNYDILQYSAGTFPVWYNTSSPFLSGLTATTISATTYLGLPYSGTSNYVVKWSGSTGLTDSLIYDNGSIVVVSGTTATVSGSKFSVTGPIAAGGVQLSSKNESIAIATSNYASWGTGVKQIAIGEAAPLGSSTGSNNIAIGSASMKNAVTPSGNTAIGTETLNVLESGNYNVAIGYNTAKNLDQSDEAVYIGYQAGLNGGLSTYNVVLGSQAAMSLSGVNNVAIGRLAFGSKLTGNGNVAIGVGAGRESTGGGNVFLGFQAGYYSTGDNKLYIHNSLGNPPLIYGEFDNLRLGIGTTAVTNTLHVSAATNPVRFQGLQQSALTRYLVADVNGVVYFTTGVTSGGTSTSGDYLPLSGGTVSGNTIFQSGLTATTISATTYQGLPLFLSGGSYNTGTTTLSLFNSTGGTFYLSGFAQTFSGGSGNCINQLYLNELYPCNDNIKIQPSSDGNVFFGSLSGASGFTVDLVSDTVYETARLGLNTTLPEHTIDFYSRDRKNRLYLSDNLTNVYNVTNDPTIVGIGNVARMIINQTYDDVVLSWVGNSITIYNSSGDSVTKTLGSVSLNSPVGFTRLNFIGTWSQDYSEAAGGFFVRELSIGDGQNGAKSLIFSGDSDTRSSLTVSGPSRFGTNGFAGISMGFRGYTTSGTVLNNQFGVTGDSFIRVFTATNGLNIINEVGTNTDNYIRFYAGQNFIDNVPDIHIQGSGTTRGYVGINITGVTNTLHVSAATHPVRFEGLVSSANTRYLVANSDGVVTYTTSSPGGGGTGFSAITINTTPQFNSSLSQVLNFSGINLTITSAATNTLVFSAGTGGGGGVTSITAGYGVSANTSTGNVTIIQVFDYGKAYTTGNNLNFL